jgi:hypothetical protein
LAAGAGLRLRDGFILHFLLLSRLISNRIVGNHIFACLGNNLSLWRWVFDKFIENCLFPSFGGNYFLCCL